MAVQKNIIKVKDVVRVIEQMAPRSAAAEWDNVGLLVGSYDKEVRRVMTCLTITPTTCQEAIAKNADLIITHHPILFRGTKSITDHSYEGRLLLQLIKNDICVYSAHTAFDNVVGGINDMIAQGLQLSQINPLRLAKGEYANQIVFPGEGRIGVLSSAFPLEDVARKLSDLFGVQGLQLVGQPQKTIKKVAVACGAAGEFLRDAIKQGANLFVTGEMRFHDCLVAEAEDIALCIPGHFATERFSMVRFASWLEQKCSAIEVWPSQDEIDPLRWLQI